MMKLLKGRWVQLGIGVAVALAVGVGISPLLPSAPDPITVGDRAMLTSGEAFDDLVHGTVARTVLLFE